MAKVYAHFRNGSMQGVRVSEAHPEALEGEEHIEIPDIPRGPWEDAALAAEFGTAENCPLVRLPPLMRFGSTLQPTVDLTDEVHEWLVEVCDLEAPEGHVYFGMRFIPRQGNEAFAAGRHVLAACTIREILDANGLARVEAGSTLTIAPGPAGRRVELVRLLDRWFRKAMASNDSEYLKQRKLADLGQPNQLDAVLADYAARRTTFLGLKAKVQAVATAVEYRQMRRVLREAIAGEKASITL